MSAAAPAVALMVFDRRRRQRLIAQRQRHWRRRTVDEDFRDKRRLGNIHLVTSATCKRLISISIAFKL